MARPDEEQAQDRTGSAPERERQQDGSAWTPPTRASEAQRDNEEPEVDAPKGASGEHWTPERGTEHDR